MPTSITRPSQSKIFEGMFSSKRLSLCNNALVQIEVVGSRFKAKQNQSKTDYLETEFHVAIALFKSSSSL